MNIIDRLRSIGPGAMVAAAFIGPGTVTTASVTGAEFGYALVWTIVFSIIATIVLQEMSARLGVVSRHGLGEALREQFDSQVAVVLQHRARRERHRHRDGGLRDGEHPRRGRRFGRYHRNQRTDLGAGHGTLCGRAPLDGSLQTHRKGARRARRNHGGFVPHRRHRHRSRPRRARDGVRPERSRGFDVPHHGTHRNDRRRLQPVPPRRKRPRAMGRSRTSYRSRVPTRFSPSSSAASSPSPSSSPRPRRSPSERKSTT